MALFKQLFEFINHIIARFHALMVPQFEAPISVLERLPYKVDGYLRHGEKLGEGAASTVYQTTLNGQPVAFKKFNYDFLKSYQLEKTILMAITHPNIIRLIAYVERGVAYQGLILELCAGGTLDKYLRDHQQGNRDPAFLRQVTLDIAQGMVYLHMMGYIHRDLTGKNILLGSNNKAIIADFSLSAHVSDGKLVHVEEAGIGNLVWGPPELGSWIYTRAIDVYHFGWFLYLMSDRMKVDPPVGAYMYSPKPYVDNGRLMNSPGMQQFIVPETKAFLLKCWEFYPHKRPAFDVIYKQLQQQDLLYRYT